MLYIIFVGTLLTFILPGMIYRRVVPSNSLPSAVTRSLSGSASVGGIGVISGSFYNGTLLVSEMKRLDHRDRMRLIAQCNIFVGFVLMVIIVTATLLDASARY